ncbi:GNAT family N-acetyltransferase [Kutzneria kofuensis]|uniref:GNAT superfamily N-acetyltransferase n=1 Tax=Kutzneria kofuensis TaxID=103725 RepID=A0A7W9KSA5_9PSEU|nr:GNAT family N-acetyltransferase [Kutzneria kofuensis]MBB5897702.1 GNAT superfamily N-acetyltransferase [Kutzneria kofuensis]
MVVIRSADQPGDLGWMVQAHGELYAAEYGWDSSFERLVAGIVGEFDPKRDAGWIAELDGRRVGCVLCVAGDDGEAVLRILLVHPDGRGQGIGGRLVDTCLEHARARGCRVIRLWTNDCLDAARRIYLSRGFGLVDEQPHHSFGADLIGQTYRLTLV